MEVRCRKSEVGQKDGAGPKKEASFRFMLKKKRKGRYVPQSESDIRSLKAP